MNCNGQGCWVYGIMVWYGFVCGMEISYIVFIVWFLELSYDAIIAYVICLYYLLSNHIIILNSCIASNEI